MLIRGLIYSLQTDKSKTLQPYAQALEVLELGSAKWPNAENSERGEMFADTFIRGVRRLYLNAHMNVSRSCNRQRMRPSMPHL